MNSITYSTSDTFPPLITYQYQLIDLILTFKAVYHADPSAERNDQDQAYIFQDTYSESR